MALTCPSVLESNIQRGDTTHGKQRRSSKYTLLVIWQAGWSTLDGFRFLWGLRLLCISFINLFTTTNNYEDTPPDIVHEDQAVHIACNTRTEFWSKSHKSRPLTSWICITSSGDKGWKKVWRMRCALLTEGGTRGLYTWYNCKRHISSVYEPSAPAGREKLGRSERLTLEASAKFRVAG